MGCCSTKTKDDHGESKVKYAHMEEDGGTVSEYSEESSRDRDFSRSLSQSIALSKDERYWEIMEADDGSVKG